MWMSHVIYVNDSYHTCKKKLDGSRDTRKQVVSRKRVTAPQKPLKITMSLLKGASFQTHLTRVNQSWERETREKDMRQGTKRCEIQRWDKSLSFQTHLTPVNQSHRTNCCVTHLRERRSFLVFFWKGTPFQIISHKWINHVTQITRFFLERDLLSRIRVCEVIDLHVWDDSCLRVTWPIHMQDTWYDLFTNERGHMTWLNYKWVWMNVACLKT